MSSTGKARSGPSARGAGGGSGVPAFLTLGYYVRKPSRAAGLFAGLIVFSYVVLALHSSSLENTSLKERLSKMENQVTRLGSQMHDDGGEVDEDVVREEHNFLKEKNAKLTQQVQKLAKIVESKLGIKGGDLESSGDASGGGGSGHWGGGLKKPKGKLDAKTAERQKAVKGAMEHAWGNYVKYAWGQDELMPLSKRGKNSFNGMGATIIDSLDTLYIMGMIDEFNKARDWVRDTLSFDGPGDISFFETTIRMVGGLVSAYDLSGEQIFLDRVVELADKMIDGFNTPTGIPGNDYNLHSGRGRAAAWSMGSATLAEFGTLQMEFVSVSQRTGKKIYAEKVEKIIDVVLEKPATDGLYPLYFNNGNGQFTSDHISFGAMGDSFYEYLLKMYLLGGKTPKVKRYLDAWKAAMVGVHKHLIFKSTPGGYTYIAESIGSTPIHKMDHLACFVGGMLSLGAQYVPEHEKKWFDTGAEITKTCYMFYEKEPTKIAGDMYQFTDGSDFYAASSGNVQRPETVESLFYLWRLTHDEKYRDWGWNIFQAFIKMEKVEGGFAGLNDVRRPDSGNDDTMQSFFLAETLKYLYLLFSPDDLVDLDEWVFNTEAHPLRVTPRKEWR